MPRVYDSSGREPEATQNLAARHAIFDGRTRLGKELGLVKVPTGAPNSDAASQPRAKGGNEEHQARAGEKRGAARA